MHRHQQSNLSMNLFHAQLILCKLIDTLDGGRQCLLPTVITLYVLVGSKKGRGRDKAVGTKSMAK